MDFQPTACPDTIVNCSQEIVVTSSRPDVTVFSNVKTDLGTTPGNFGPPLSQCWDPSSPALVSQTQGNDDISRMGSVDEDNCIDIPSDKLEHGKIAAQVNTVFDETYDYLSAQIKAITDHRYIAGIIELKVEYTDGGTSWYPISLVKDEKPHATAKICW